MDSHLDILGWVRPAGGTTAFPWLRDGSNARELCTALASAGVLLAPGDCFDAPKHFRLGYSAQAEGFARALEIVAETVRVPRAVSVAAGGRR
jgi:aspartate/methionine/tyrosine aminotransferase